MIRSSSSSVVDIATTSVENDLNLNEGKDKRPTVASLDDHESILTM